jgi:hypothetical protein
MKADPEVTRLLIHDENEMINHRIHWFLILQGFMFASLAFAWGKNSALCIVFSIVGMLSAVSVGVLLRYGILAIQKLEQSIQEETQPVLGRGSKETSAFMQLLLPWHFLPVLMVVAWSALICIRVFNVD